MVETSEYEGKEIDSKYIDKTWWLVELEYR